MESSTFKLYSTFNSWDEFEKAAKEYIDDTFQPFVKASSKKVEAQNKGMKATGRYPIEMGYFYKMYCCSHRGKFVPRGLGLRETKSNKEGCTAKIQARLDANNKTRIVVTVLDERHNHEIGEHLYKRYAHNRCLTRKEKEHANKLCSLNVSNKDLRREMEVLTGKKVTLQDVMNRKKTRRREEKDAVRGDHSYNYNVIEEPDEDGAFDWPSHTLSKRVKYSIVKTKLDNISKKLLEVGTESFNFYMDRLDEVDMFISSSSKFSVSDFNVAGSSNVTVNSVSAIDVDNSDSHFQCC